MANAVLVTGSATISVNPLETKAILSFFPDPDGEGWDISAVNKLASEKNVPAFPDPKVLEAFLVKAGKAKNVDLMEMVFASGIPPENSVGEKVTWEALPVPDDMASIKEEVLAGAEAPEIFRVKVERIKREQTVKKTGALSSKSGKEESVSWEKKETRERANVDTSVLEVKYAGRGMKLGTITPSTPGKPGKNISGRQIPPPAVGEETFLFGKGIIREKNEIHAELAGFVRIGESWADIVPMAKHSYGVSTGTDGITPFFHFDPGDKKFPLPSGEEILAGAAEKGAKKENLVSAIELDKAIGEAAKTRQPIEAFSLFHPTEAEVKVEINQDKTLALLSLRKGVAGAKPLEVKAISQAINESGVQGYDTEKLKTDIRAFMEGKELFLSDYVLLEGVSSTRGKNREIQLSVDRVAREEKELLTLRLRDWYSQNFSENVDFDLDKEFDLARVKEGQKLAVVSEGSKGNVGKDIFGNVIPGLPGNDPDIKLFNALELRGSEILALQDGLLVFTASENEFYGKVIDYEDARVGIHVSADAMEATGDFFRETGPGIHLTVENVEKEMSALGVKKGIDWEALEKACVNARENGSALNCVIARGRFPIAKGGSGYKWYVPLTLPKLTSPEDSASEGKPVQVKAGTIIVDLSQPVGKDLPGYDVLGREIPIDRETAFSIKFDGSIREAALGKGKRLIAARSGELGFYGGILKIGSVKTIQGDVDPSEGNLKFSGEIRISGNVLPGGVVMSSSHVIINGMAEGAFISAGGKAIVKLGFKGNGRGILKARAGIVATSVECASVAAVGDIKLINGSVVSKIKTNGKLLITAERGKLSGGVCQARNGIDAAEIGSEDGLRTEISFGQDYLVKDQIAAYEEELAKVREAISKLEEKMGKFLKSKLPLPEDLRLEKVRMVKRLEQVNLRLFNLREKFEEHFESEVRSRGAVFPGVVIESHNRYYEVKQKRSGVVFYFDRGTGRIKEKPLA